MSYTYAKIKKPGGAETGAAASGGAKESAIPNSARLAALQSGAAKPSAEELGHRVEMPDAVRARMESSFGADLSAVKLYQSQAVADAGAEAVTSGSSIAFAPGKLDFASSGGKALLGHELSHFVSQARGEVAGGGFLDSPALEARADREGAMAARGESVSARYGGAAAPLSNASAAPMAGPMQAKKSPEEEGAKKASKLAKMEAKYAKLPLNKKEGRGITRKMSKMRRIVATDPYAYQALYLKRNEKMRKEMEMDARYGAGNHRYNSVDRYQTAINNVEFMQHRFSELGDIPGMNITGQQLSESALGMREPIFEKLSKNEDFMAAHNAYTEDSNRPDPFNAFKFYLSEQQQKKNEDDEDDEEIKTSADNHIRPPQIEQQPKVVEKVEEEDDEDDDEDDDEEEVEELIKNEKNRQGQDAADAAMIQAPKEQGDINDLVPEDADSPLNQGFIARRPKKKKK